MARVALELGDLGDLGDLGQQIADIAAGQLRDSLERWVYQAADHRDWQIDQIKPQAEERA